MKDMQDANPMLQETPNDTPAEAKQPEPAAKDGIDRRNFLSCMAWAGTGLVWTMMGGVPTSKLFAATAGAAGKDAARAHAGSGFSFVQISDSHIGFNKAANRGARSWSSRCKARAGSRPKPRPSTAPRAEPATGRR